MASGTLTTNTDSTVFRATGDRNCPLRITVNGTWGGATATLKEEGADGTYRAVEDGAFTADVNQEFTPIFGRGYKITTTNVGTTSLYYEIVQQGSQS